MRANIVIIRNSDLNNKQLQDVIKLKKQSWNYSNESQIYWIKKNFNDEDLHQLFFIKTTLIAYLSITKVLVNINNICIEFLGIGNVCVDKRYKGVGIGSECVRKVNKYIITHNKPGVLLCNESLIPFYKKNGWELFDLGSQNVFVGGIPYKKSIMIYNFSQNTYHSEIKNTTIVFNRNF